MRVLVKARTTRNAAVSYLQVVSYGFDCNLLAIHTKHMRRKTNMLVVSILHVKSVPHAHVHGQLKLGDARHETTHLGHHHADFLPWPCASSASSPHTLPFQQGT